MSIFRDSDVSGFRAVCDFGILRFYDFGLVGFPDFDISAFLGHRSNMRVLWGGDEASAFPDNSGEIIVNPPSRHKVAFTDRNRG